ncbi:GSCOCG00011711001-RA-CDS [Cotesia congregata]|nr:GSCOCG00011711001-RA-CDS [Cotesia congregata]
MFDYTSFQVLKIDVLQRRTSRGNKAIYDMLGACSSNRPADSAEERAKNIFAKMDENNDGQLTQDEFLKGCLQDEELSKMLAP